MHYTYGTKNICYYYMYSDFYAPKSPRASRSNKWQCLLIRYLIQIETKTYLRDTSWHNPIKHSTCTTYIRKYQNAKKLSGIVSQVHVIEYKNLSPCQSLYMYRRIWVRDLFLLFHFDMLYIHHVQVTAMIISN